jgi:hypothetical protein
MNVYEKTLPPHSPQLTAEKNRVRAETEKCLRRFVNRFLRYEPVTDLDRDYMKIPNPDLIRTPHTDIKEVVEFELRLRNIREVVVNFWVKGETNRAKPVKKLSAFWLGSLRYVQTPHINSWSLAVSKTPKLSGVAGSMTGR